MDCSAEAGISVNLRVQETDVQRVDCILNPNFSSMSIKEKIVNQYSTLSLNEIILTNINDFRLFYYQNMSKILTTSLLPSP